MGFWTSSYGRTQSNYQIEKYIKLIDYYNIKLFKNETEDHPACRQKQNPYIIREMLVYTMLFYPHNKIKADLQQNSTNRH